MSEKIYTDEDLRVKLAIKRQEHQDLDQAISALLIVATVDQLQIGRLKRKKLALKDEIKALENQFLPDIIA